MGIIDKQIEKFLKLENRAFYITLGCFLATCLGFYGWCYLWTGYGIDLIYLGIPLIPFGAAFWSWKRYNKYADKLDQYCRMQFYKENLEKLLREGKGIDGNITNPNFKDKND